MFFPGGHVLLQIVLRTGVIYALVLIGVRLSGKREVGQMTPFDLTLLLLLSNSVQNAMTPLTTSSIPHSNARAGVVGTSRKKIDSPLLPKPVGPVSVGGAPLSPAPAPGSRAG